MRGLIPKLFALIIFSIIAFISCGTVKPTYITKHGLNIYCRGSCFPQEQVEQATDLVIDQLVLKDSENFSHKIVTDFLKRDRKWHDIIILPPQEGPPGSCGNEHDPDRACRGVQCPGASPTGWCAGSHYIRRYCSHNVCTDSSEMKIVKYEDCISVGSLVHELIHFFRHHIVQETDYNHEMQLYWPSACVGKYPDPEDLKSCAKSTAVSSVNWNLCEQYCFCKE